MARHQTNHLRFSRAIDDPVAAIATDGSEVSAALRNDYLNRANNFIQLTILGLTHGEWSLRREMFMRYAPGLVTNQAITWASGGTTVGASDPNGYCEWIEATDATAGLLTPHFSKPELDLNLNSNLPNAFLIHGGKIYGYVSGVQKTSGSGTLFYVTSDIQTTSDATPNIDAKWDDTLVELAIMFYKQDKGEFEEAMGHLRASQIVLDKMRGM